MPYQIHSALLFSGSYRLLGEDDCAHYSVETEESTLMEDGDMATCELVDSGTNNMFGIFFKEAWCRSVVVTVYGHGISCSPTDGIGLTIVSNNYQRYTCKAYKMETEDVCQYKCVCPVDGLCNHVAMIINSVETTSETPRICESKISPLLWWQVEIVHKVKK